MMLQASPSVHHKLTAINGAFIKPILFLIYLFNIRNYFELTFKL